MSKSENQDFSTCKLCLEPKKLIKKSHIIPKFMYKGIIGGNLPAMMVNREQSERKRLPIGAYESNILCSNCDNKILGGYENYASRALYGGNLKASECPQFTTVKDPSSPDDLLTIKVENMDYHKFKFFLLSLIWRASISNHSLFERINIGHNEEVIRRKLFSGQSIPENMFAVGLIALQHEYLDFRKILATGPANPRNHELQVIFVNGIYYLFDLTDSGSNSYVQKSRLKQNNTMEIMLLKGKKAEKFYSKYF
jgi:hypothetical protein